jgi:hypothetical protein
MYIEETEKEDDETSTQENMKGAGEEHVKSRFAYFTGEQF